MNILIDAYEISTVKVSLWIPNFKVKNKEKEMTVSLKNGAQQLWRKTISVLLRSLENMTRLKTT